MFDLGLLIERRPGYTRRQLHADLCNYGLYLSYSNLSGYLTGSNKPRIDFVKGIYDLMGTKEQKDLFFPYILASQEVSSLPDNLKVDVAEFIWEKIVGS